MLKVSILFWISITSLLALIPASITFSITQNSFLIRRIFVTVSSVAILFGGNYFFLPLIFIAGNISHEELGNNDEFFYQNQLSNFTIFLIGILDLAIRTNTLLIWFIVFQINNIIVQVLLLQEKEGKLSRYKKSAFLRSVFFIITNNGLFAVMQMTNNKDIKLISSTILIIIIVIQSLNIYFHHKKIYLFNIKKNKKIALVNVVPKFIASMLIYKILIFCNLHSHNNCLNIIITLGLLFLIYFSWNMMQSQTLGSFLVDYSNFCFGAMLFSFIALNKAQGMESIIWLENNINIIFNTCLCVTVLFAFVSFYIPVVLKQNIGFSDFTGLFFSNKFLSFFIFFALITIGGIFPVTVGCIMNLNLLNLALFDVNANNILYVLIIFIALIFNQFSILRLLKKIVKNDQLKKIKRVSGFDKISMIGILLLLILGVQKFFSFIIIQ